jgi:NADH:ubiquinone oxidoreductase subunit 6 (subunit J)
LTRRAAIAALVVPALVLVAIAARSYQPFGGEPGGERAASTAFLDSMFTIVLVLGVALTVIALWVVIGMPRRSQRRRSRSSIYSGLLAFLLIFGFVIIGGRGLLQYDRQPANEQGSDAAFPQQAQPGQPVPKDALERTPRVVWPLAVGLGALIAAAVVVAVLVERRRRRQRSDAPTPEQLEELGRALDEAIDDLRRDPDPRRAVIAAYARMERALTVYGLPRKPSEAPYEYLHRVARELEAEGPVASLTELFEVAKFSEHSVDETMRGRAIDALTAVRAEVRAEAT